MVQSCFSLQVLEYLDCLRFFCFSCSLGRSHRMSNWIIWHHVPNFCAELATDELRLLFVLSFSRQCRSEVTRVCHFEKNLLNQMPLIFCKGMQRGNPVSPTLIQSQVWQLQAVREVKWLPTTSRRTNAG